MSEVKLIPFSSGNWLLTLAIRLEFCRRRLQFLVSWVSGKWPSSGDFFTQPPNHWNEHLGNHFSASWDSKLSMAVAMAPDLDHYNSSSDIRGLTSQFYICWHHFKIPSLESALFSPFHGSVSISFTVLNLFHLKIPGVVSTSCIFLKFLSVMCWTL